MMGRPKKIDTFDLPKGMTMGEKAIHNKAIDEYEAWLKDRISEEEIREVIRKYFYEMMTATTQKDYEFIDDNAVDLAKAIKKYVEGL